MNIEELQRAIYKQAKQKALSLKCEASKELSNYLEDQQKSAKRKFSISNEKELKNAIEQSDIILVGDFHTFDQNNKNFLRIITKLISKNSDFVIAVEFIHNKYQHVVDAFLNDEITEIEFLEEIKYHDSWHFPWPHYKSFFELAKRFKIDVVAINSDGALPDRDQFAAKIINSINKKVLVFIGELHIVADKLPLKLKKMNSNNDILVIHQNIDDIFWELKQNQYIVKFNDREFSLQTSPPWIKYESLNYWFDYLDEDPDFDLNDYIMNQGVLLFNSSINDNFFEITKRISEVLQLEIDHSILENFNLYDHQSLKKVLQKVNLLKDKNIHDFLEKQLINGAIFNLPNSRIYYCSTYSFNRLVLIAGIHLHQIITESNKAFIDFNSQSSSLSYFTQKRIFSYLISKLINPFRKCDRYKDIHQNIVKDIIDCNSDDKLEKIIEDLNLEDLSDIGHILGSYMGELLYENLFLHKMKKYIFILECLKDTNFDKITLYFLIRSIFNHNYTNDTKRIF